MAVSLQKAMFVDRIPSVGALLGTSGTAAVVQSINQQLGSVRFGELNTRFAEAHNAFHRQVVAPLRAAAEQVKSLATTLHNPDTFRPLVTEEDFKSIPPCMWIPIVQYAPVKSLLKQGRVWGFGLDPDYLDEEDTWGRLVDNGKSRDVAADMDKDGYVTLTAVHWSDDPEHRGRDLSAIETTREAIDRLLEETNLDPTSISCLRG